MIIYSVTVSVDKSVSPEWLAWMRDRHIPAVMATGFFEDFSLHRLLDPVVDTALETYNIHYRCASEALLARYQAEAAPALQADHQQRYGTRAVAFRTVLVEL
jgi:hypothetical protein